VFGIGFPELIFILLLAVLILGPEHAPGAARMIGRWSAKMRSAATSLSQAVAEDENLREINQSMTVVKNEIAQTTSEIAGTIGETGQTLREARAELKAFGRNTEAQPAAEPKTAADAVAGHDDFDFMDRPLNWFGDDSASEKKVSGESMRTIRLNPAMKPKSALDKVSERAIRLDRPTSDTVSQTTVVRLDAPEIRGFCRIRPLERSRGAKPSCVRTIHLIRARLR
jgi:Tat protein translocase TatB subunit